jgi:hypothetical protein
MSMTNPNDPLAPRTTAVWASPETIVSENVMPVRNQVQWGPIIAGTLTAIVAFLLLTVLGFALGASVLDPRNTAGQIGSWAAAWGAFTAILAFLLGGWIAARSAAVPGTFAGLMQGLMVGAVGLLFMIWLTANGLGNLFGTIGSTVGTVLSVTANAVPAVGAATNVTSGQAGNAVEQQTGVDVNNPQAAATAVVGQVQTAANEAGKRLAAADNPQTFDVVRKGALGTFGILLVPLLAGAIGGWLGKYQRKDLVRGTGA